VARSTPGRGCGGDRTVLAWVDSTQAAGRGTRYQLVAAVAHGRTFGAPQVLPVHRGDRPAADGDDPVATADPTTRPTVLTYGAGRGPFDIGQLAFLRG
jgi:hypothetical protein